MKLTERTTCRACGDELGSEIILTLGNQEIVDFPLAGDQGRGKAPLDLVSCKSCDLLQLKHTVDPDTLFRKFFYRSSVNEQMRAALKNVTESIKKRISITTRDLVGDIGSNDGYLLSTYALGVRKIGFEPALDLAEESKVRVSKVVPNYFNAKEALEASNGELYKAITAIAMFYDLDNPREFLKDVWTVLDPAGLFVVQMNYLPLMLQNVTFDNIGHEHLCYYSLTTLKKLFDSCGLKIVDAETNDVNGGSIRIYARKQSGNEIWKVSYRYDIMLDEEQDLNIQIDQFKDRVKDISSKILTFVKKAKEADKVVYAYGASTRGLTLLQAVFKDEKVTDYITGVAERDPNKFGRRMAGIDLPIVSEPEARAAADYMILLPYHFWRSISQREKEWMEKGGKFIIPIPFVKVVGMQEIMGNMALASSDIDKEFA